MKPSDILTGLKEAMSLSSHAHSVMSLFSALRGEEPSSDAPAAAKGLYGIFGSRDEREFDSIMTKVSEKDGCEDAREVFANFHKWASLKEDGVAASTVNKFYWNWFRSFVVKRNAASTSKSIEAEVSFSSKRRNGETLNLKVKKATDVETTIKSKSGDETIHLRSKEPSKGDTTHDGVLFMEMVIKTIKDADDKPTKGYKKLALYLRAEGIPLPSQDAHAFLAEAVHFLQNLPQHFDWETNRAAVRIRTQRRKEEAEYGIARRFYESFCG